MRDTEMAVAIWQAGVDAVGGYAAVETGLTGVGAPDRILAVGKAAGAMARAALDRFGAVPTLVVTKDGHGDGLPEHVDLIEASHPVPDARSLQGGRALRKAVAELGPDTHLLVLVSGGASSLAEDPVEGFSIEDLVALNARLLAAGLDIGAMNAERRRFSRIKGGGLLSGFGGARVTVLAISDVPGDDIAVIGSGIGVPPARGDVAVDLRIVASNAIAREAACAAARAQVLAVHDAREALHDDLFVLARQLGPQLRGMEPGVMVLGGEPTVVLPPSPGRGGRNQGLALALAREIAGIEGLTVVVGGTDGTDGPTDAAGGIVDGTTWGDGAQAALDAANSGNYLDQRDALLTTGPTGTNVMDLLVAFRR